MSTRCFIGVELPEGSIVSIYCHWDGYPDGVGDTLVCHYRDRDKIMKLLQLGDLSSLQATPEDSEAYCRDRGEDLHPARIMSEQEMAEAWAEYSYKFTLQDEWQVKSLLDSSRGWVSVEAAIASPEILEFEDYDSKS